MHARYSTAMVLLMALGSPRALEASPITYDFAGTFSQPIDGSTQFSGSFTIDSVPNAPISLPTWDGSGIGEDGSAISLTLTMGGQTLHFVSDPNNPGATLFFQGGVYYPPTTTTSIDSRVPYVGYSLQGTSGTADPVNFYLDFEHAGTNLQLSDLANLASSSYTINGYASQTADGQTQSAGATISSIELVSAPEPGMLAVFGLMAVAGITHFRRRRPDAWESR